MNNQIVGFVTQIQEVKIITEKFSVQNVIVQTEGQYPQNLPIQFSNDQINLVGRLKVGSKVEFNININGKEYTNKNTGEIGHFVSINCWSFNLLDSEVLQKEEKAPAGSKEEAENTPSEPKDDLPF
jgi:hypothetical protein